MMCTHVNNVVSHYLSQRSTTRIYHNYNGEHVANWYECSHTFTDWLLARGVIVLETNKGRFIGLTGQCKPILCYELEYRNAHNLLH